MLVACKYEEMFAPEVGDFAYMTDNAFSKSQILRMEQVVLSSLHFQLGRPLPLHFLRRASKVADVSVWRRGGRGVRGGAERACVSLTSRGTRWPST